jgi:hypothetical protein
MRIGLLLGAVAISLAMARTAQGEEILHIGYESESISPQPGVVAERPMAADSINVDCSVARAGRCSLKTILRRTDDYISYGRHRAETDTMQLEPLRYSAGESYRYGFSFRTDKYWQYDNREAIDVIWQFKRFDSHSDMFIALKGHDVVLRVLTSDQYVLEKDFQPGIWMDVKVEVLWSAGPDGRVAAYIRREDEASYRRVAGFEGPNIFNSLPRFARPKWGIYKPAFPKSDFEGPRIVFHDEIFVEKLN